MVRHKSIIFIVGLLAMIQIPVLAEMTKNDFDGKLNVAVEEGDVATVTELLNYQFQDPSETSVYVVLALWQAADLGQTDVVSCILNHPRGSKISGDSLNEALVNAADYEFDGDPKEFDENKSVMRPLLNLSISSISAKNLSTILRTAHEMKRPDIVRCIKKSKCYNELFRELGNEDASSEVRNTIHTALRAMGMTSPELVQVKKMSENGPLGFCFGETIWIKESNPCWQFTCFHEAGHCYIYYNNLDSYGSGREEHEADMLAVKTLHSLKADDVVEHAISHMKEVAYNEILRLINQMPSDQLADKDKPLVIEQVARNLDTIIQTRRVEYKNTCLLRFSQNCEKGYPSTIRKIMGLQAAMDPLKKH